MTDDPVALDAHRGMIAQRDTEIRRRRSEIEADQAALRGRQEDLDRFMLAAPAANWSEAVERATYLLAIFATTGEGRDPRRQRLIASVLDDFKRLSKMPPPSDLDC